MSIKCTFVSIWDDNVMLHSPAIYDENTGEIEVLQIHEVGGLDILIREYIQLPDGDQLDVCPECHEYALKTVMVETTGKNLVETKECPSPDCSYKA